MNKKVEDKAGDSDPANKKPQHKQPSKDHAKTSKPHGGVLKTNGLVFFIINAGLSIVIAVAVAILAVNGGNKLQQQKELLVAQQQKMQASLQEQKDLFAEIKRQAEQNSYKQNQALQEIRQTVEAFISQKRYSYRGWLVAEAEYLVKLANHRLILAGDIPTSIQALMAADDRLREVGNPRYIPVRQALAADIQKLNSVPKVDTVGLSLKLNALQKQLETVPLSTPEPASVMLRKEKALSVSKVESWKQLPAAIWNDLLKLFRIQHHDEAIKPLLQPEQRFYLVQNIKLQLEQARLALLSNHPVIYKDRLAQAKQWLQQYFDIKHPSTIALTETLDKLIATNIKQQLPDLSNSLEKLQLLHTEETSLRSNTAKKPADPQKSRKKTVNNKKAKKKTLPKVKIKKEAVKKQVKPVAGKSTVKPVSKPEDKYKEKKHKEVKSKKDKPQTETPASKNIEQQTAPAATTL